MELNRVHSLLWASCFLGVLQVCAGKQDFRQQPAYTEVNPQETAVLSCRVSNKVEFCSWQKDRKPIRTFPGKYEWNGATDTGDCSLRIINATLVYDDGEWECQVPPSAFDKMDALSSEPARLVVRVAPKEPSLEFNTSRLERGRNLTTAAEASAAVKCLSRYGNPPAAIRWYLDEVDVTAYAVQTNNTEPDKPRTWLATSVLTFTFPRAANGRMLRCLTFHDAFEQKSKEVNVKVNVQYAPITKLQGRPDRELEESVDSLRLSCTADANPPAEVTWKKDGVDQHSSNKIEFSPLKRTHSGVYMCQARNALGLSVTPTVSVDVKYAPKIRNVTPTRAIVSLSNRTTLSCSAEGNPAPAYRWLHSLTGNPDESVEAGREATLLLRNTTYDNQGKYVCVATNVINARERAVQSQEVLVEVFGPPQVLTRGSPSSKDSILTDKGLDAIIRIPFCSKPNPSKVSWEWGSLLLPAGEGAGGKYIANAISEMKDVQGCYEARLIVQKADASDARRYIFKVENSYGETQHAVFLHVQEPIAMMTVIGIVIACLAALVITIMVVLYAFRAQRWCFRGKEGMELQPKDSESDCDGKSYGTDNRSGNTGAIPPDALYSVPAKSKSSQRSDDISEYNSMISNNHHNDTHHPPCKPEVVYADLDLGNFNTVGLPPTSRGKILNQQRDSPTEYAHIQYRPRPDEQADI